MPGSRTPGALDGLRVVDFSTLLPGPLATLLLAEAGADVVKVERPGAGDEMRSYTPRLGSTSANFALLNRGKRSVTADLKDPEGHAAVWRLLTETDVVVEQFRPGVLDRLGLGYEQVREANPGVVYCSVTGYGQHGPMAQRAGHDLTYLAEAGLLDVVRDGAGDSPLPATVLADIAGGSYPAVLNILLALTARARTGIGAHLDISMTDNVFPLAYTGIANHEATGDWPTPAAGLLTGGSPRYRVYRTADRRQLAAAPIEERFWARFCELIELPDELRDDSVDPAKTIAAVADRIAARSSVDWQRRFDGEDVCCAIVATQAEAHAALLENSEHQRHRVRGHGVDAMALPMPLAPQLRGGPRARSFPELGEHNSLLESVETGE
ncbi:MAG: CoA transferase [Pseudonocardiaceae bacterium]|nr:CoA transferase [Pseudonocardiaceae bacterium]